MRTVLSVVIIGLIVSVSLHGNELSYVPVDSPADLGRFGGMKVVIIGTVSKTPWQHMISVQENYPFSEYFDFNGNQTVIYSRERIRTDRKIRIFGTVIKIEGQSKDPRRKESAAEYHILVDRWEIAGQ